MDYIFRCPACQQRLKNPKGLTMLHGGRLQMQSHRCVYEGQQAVAALAQEFRWKED